MKKHVAQIHVAFVLGSIVVSIPACHAGDRGSIPRRGAQVLKGIKSKTNEINGNERK